MHVCVHVWVYIYIHTHTHTHIHTYIDTHTPTHMRIYILMIYMFGLDKDLDLCFFKVFLCHVFYVKEFEFFLLFYENRRQNTGVPKEREDIMIFFSFPQK